MHPKILLNYSIWSCSREDGCTVHQTRAMWLIDRDFWSARFRVHRDPRRGLGAWLQAVPYSSIGTNTEPHHTVVT